MSKDSCDVGFHSGGPAQATKNHPPDEPEEVPVVEYANDPLSRMYQSMDVGSLLHDAFDNMARYVVAPQLRREKPPFMPRA